MASFVMQFFERREQIMEQQKQLQDELNTRWAKMCQTLADRIGDELYQKLDAYSHYKYNTTLVGRIFCSDEMKYWGYVTVDFQTEFLQRSGLPENLTEIRNILLVLQEAWSDVVQIEIESDDSSGARVRAMFSLRKD